MSRHPRKCNTQIHRTAHPSSGLSSALQRRGSLRPPSTASSRLRPQHPPRAPDSERRCVPRSIPLTLPRCSSPEGVCHPRPYSSQPSHLPTFKPATPSTSSQRGPPTGEWRKATTLPRCTSSEGVCDSRRKHDATCGPSTVAAAQRGSVSHVPSRSPQLGALAQRGSATPVPILPNLPTFQPSELQPPQPPRSEAHPPASGAGPPPYLGALAQRGSATPVESTMPPADPAPSPQLKRGSVSHVPSRSPQLGALAQRGSATPVPILPNLPTFQPPTCTRSHRPMHTRAAPCPLSRCNVHRRPSSGRSSARSPLSSEGIPYALPTYAAAWQLSAHRELQLPRIPLRSVCLIWLP